MVGMAHQFKVLKAVVHTVTVLVVNHLLTVKPTPEELRNCRPYFERELELLKNLKVLVALGKVAFDTYLEVLKARGAIRSRAAFVFGHDCQFTTAPGQPLLVSSYHPSQQNTSTGKLTEKMLVDVFRRARRLADKGADSETANQLAFCDAMILRANVHRDFRPSRPDRYRHGNGE